MVICYTHENGTKTKQSIQSFIAFTLRVCSQIVNNGLQMSSRCCMHVTDEQQRSKFHPTLTDVDDKTIAGLVWLKYIRFCD